jgi:hypothetical protein
MPVKTAIYEPPKEGLPYLVIAFEPDGMKVFPVDSEFEARTMVSERAIRRRRERKSEGSTALPA